MDKKNFETPKQFKPNTETRKIMADKLTAPKWFDWDDIQKPIQPSDVKISLLEGRKWAIAELTGIGMPKDDAQDNVDFLLSGALNINYAYLRANITRQMPADLAAMWPVVCTTDWWMNRNWWRLRRLRVLSFLICVICVQCSVWAAVRSVQVSGY